MLINSYQTDKQIQYLISIPSFKDIFVFLKFSFSKEKLEIANSWLIHDAFINHNSNSHLAGLRISFHYMHKLHKSLYVPDWNNFKVVVFCLDLNFSLLQVNIFHFLYNDSLFIVTDVSSLRNSQSLRLQVIQIFTDLLDFANRINKREVSLINISFVIFVKNFHNSPILELIVSELFQFFLVCLFFLGVLRFIWFYFSILCQINVIIKMSYSHSFGLLFSLCRFLLDCCLLFFNFHLLFQRYQSTDSNGIQKSDQFIFLSCSKVFYDKFSKLLNFP